jgi:archaeal flagellin FlaB
MNKINRFCKGLHRGQKGITGLETAIILIAFVTVASVLAYSVLSAGIFSSEKGKAAVYKGLDQASASMEVRGSVLALGTPATYDKDGVVTDPASVQTIQFTVASVLQDDSVDMTAPKNNSVVINYTDSNGMNVSDIGSGTAEASGTWSAALVGTERGVVNMLDADEQMVVTVTLPTDNKLTGYGSFTLQVIPPKGAAITISRTLPGAISKTMDLH